MKTIGQDGQCTAESSDSLEESEMSFNSQGSTIATGMDIALENTMTTTVMNGMEESEVQKPRFYPGKNSWEFNEYQDEIDPEVMANYVDSATKEN